MPPPRGYVRKILTVPPALAAAVKEFRFERRLESDVEAYRMLVEEGLKAVTEREAKEAEPKGRAPKRGRG